MTQRNKGAKLPLARFSGTRSFFCFLPLGHRDSLSSLLQQSHLTFVGIDICKAQDKHTNGRPYAISLNICKF